MYLFVPNLWYTSGGFKPTFNFDLNVFLKYNMHLRSTGSGINALSPQWFSWFKIIAG